MCGGRYLAFYKPKQLLQVKGETILERTIRLLHENNITNIAISSNNPMFEQFGVPVLHHENNWTVDQSHKSTGLWVDGFYPMNEPVCYLLGDVVFSPYAIKTIVEAKTDDILFFASAPPFHSGYIKEYAEPFAFKVNNTKHFKQSILKVKELEKEGRFRRPPIAWELWQVIKETQLNEINYNNYVVINDYTCDIDFPNDIHVLLNINKEL